LSGRRWFKRRFDGGSKGGEYSYPHSLVYQGRLYVIAARQKETEEVFSVPLAELQEKKG
jgi:hypothetical protein